MRIMAVRSFVRTSVGIDLDDLEQSNSPFLPLLGLLLSYIRVWLTLDEKAILLLGLEQSNNPYFVPLLGLLLVSLVFTLLHEMRPRSSNENSGCPFVRPYVCRYRP